MLMNKISIINENTEEMYQCRICLEEIDSDIFSVSDMIKPCACDGTQKYVHRECLNKWLEYNTQNINYYRCPECLQEYKFEEIELEKTCSRVLIINIHNIVKNYYLLSFLISFAIFFIFGLIGLFLAFNINSVISDVIIEFSKEYSYITIPILGNIVFSILSFIYYFFHNIILSLFYNKLYNWKDFNKNNSKKISFLSFVVLLGSLFFPPFGFIVGIMTNRLFFIYFIEFWFFKIIKKERIIIDLDDNNYEESFLV